MIPEMNSEKKVTLESSSLSILFVLYLSFLLQLLLLQANVQSSELFEEAVIG